MEGSLPRRVMPQPARRPVSVQPGRPWALIVMIALVVVAAAAVLGYAATHQGAGRPTPVTISGVEQFSELSRDHRDAPVEYDRYPPVGGAHSPAWQSCGVYDALVPPERAVHAMEHGAVWLSYRAELPAGERERVEALARGEEYVLVSPAAELPAPVVATAWGLQLRLDSASDPRLEEFVEQYAAGPQTPEPGAPCSGGEEGTLLLPASSQSPEASASASP